MKIKNIFRYIGVGVLTLTVASCQSYLDKDPDAVVSPDDAFKNFVNFQGFVEEIYNCIPDKTKHYYTTTFNWGDDEVLNPNGDWHLTNLIDEGNFWAWQAGVANQPCSWLDKPVTSSASGDRFKHALWPHAWYCIRKANMGIANINKMSSASLEQRNIILGQLYFFRAWWHFELSQWLGGLPYVNSVMPSTGVPELPRLGYQEMADLMAADLRKAADLLPCDWDTTDVGANTKGKNDMRVDKIAALGYLGKVYLWAASPLMENGAQVGAIASGKTYEYNEEYAKKAMDAFGELLTYVDNNQAACSLAPFDYKNVFDHEGQSPTSITYTDNFYTLQRNFAQPGSVEGIFRGPSYDGHQSCWTAAKTYGPKIKGMVSSDNIIHQPTANYVELYGMKNGYPLTDAANSGYDPTHPFKDRDPRFYHDIVFDGFRYVTKEIDVASEKDMQYCSLYTGGAMRDVQQASSTGYFLQKLSPHQCNKYDQFYEWSFNLHMNLSYMRLADIYLMYAEAGAATSLGAAAKASTYSMSAEEAVNVIRKRAGVDPVAAEYVADNKKFMDEVRRERAVELSFEGFRFNDLQRWLLLTEKQYTEKTSHEFTRVADDSYYTSNEAAVDAEVRGLKSKVLLRRNFSVKHYWFPFKREDVSQYPEFQQNAGW